MINNLGYLNREKIVILFSDNIKINRYDEALFIELMKHIKNNNINFSIVVIGINCEKYEINKLNNIIQNVNMSCYICIDSISKLRRQIMSNGDINNELFFTNEKYEPNGRRYRGSIL